MLLALGGQAEQVALAPPAVQAVQVAQLLLPGQAELAVQVARAVGEVLVAVLVVLVVVPTVQVVLVA